jgi:hypothetical protein
MLRLSTMLLPTGEFAVILSGEEVAGMGDASLQAFTRFKEAIGAAAGLSVPHDIEVDNALVDDVARRREADRKVDFFGVERDPEEFVDEEGFTPEDRDYEGPPLTYDNVLNGFDMDAKARSSASGAVADLDAYVGTLDGASTPVTGHLVASTEGWDSGDKLIEVDQLREEGIWEAHRDGQLIAQTPVDLLDGEVFHKGQLDLSTMFEAPRACPCYPALDGGQGEEACRQDEACVAEFGRCEDCPTLQP